MGAWSDTDRLAGELPATWGREGGQGRAVTACVSSIGCSPGLATRHGRTGPVRAARRGPVRSGGLCRQRVRGRPQGEGPRPDGGTCAFPGRAPRASASKVGGHEMPPGPQGPEYNEERQGARVRVLCLA